MNLTRLWIDNKINEKPNELLLTRAKVAYEISAVPCVKVPALITELDDIRENAEVKNSTIVDCVMNELMKLNEKSPLLDGFESLSEEEEESCQSAVDTIVDNEKSKIENFYNTAKLQSCNRDEFLQLKKLKIKVFEEYLAPTFNMSDYTFAKFSKEYGMYAHGIAEKQIECIFKEMY